MGSYRLYTKCSKCRRAFTARKPMECEHCGHRTARPWAAEVNVAPRGRDLRRKQGFPTRTAAETWATTIVAEAATGPVVKAHNETVAEYLARWLGTVQPPVMASTSYDTATIHVERYIAPRIGQVPLQQLDRTDCKRLYADLQAAGGRDGDALAYSTVHRVHTTLHTALQAATDDGLVRFNVAAGAHAAPAQADRAEVTVWEADELAAFLTWSAEHMPDWHTAWHLIAHTGLRRSEAARLTWRDVDLAAGTVTVRRAKSARGRRTIEVDAGTVEVLTAHRGATTVVDLTGWRDRRLFPVRADSFTKAWRRAMAAWPGRTIRLHDLRHTHASLLLAAGVGVHVVSRRLGHASEAFTLQIYGHLVPGQAAEAAETFASLIAAP